MAESEKGALFRALKADDRVVLDKHYRDYSVKELEEIAAPLGLVPEYGAPQAPPERPSELDEIKAQISQLTAIVMQTVSAQQPPNPEPATRPQPQQPKVKEPVLDATQHAGVTLNTHAPHEPIRVDAQGRRWFQNEVNKPGSPRPRGRRVLRDMAPDTVTETITVNGYTETFEIPGDPKFSKPIEIKVTLPSYQTGIYHEPGMPFRIHIYQGAKGFDWDDVNNFYGGSDLVPDTIKKTYVSSDLCYDITTTIRAIKDEYRETVLRQKEKNR